MSAQFDVVIVGGGAAGIGAARRLAAARQTTVLFEAASRLGGRAWTQEIAGLHLDLGCGWMHSAEKNAWVALANEAGIPLDRSRAAWGRQYRDLGFAPGEQAEARQALESWVHRLAQLDTDCTADALEPDGKWNAYIRAIVNFISGDCPERLSARDYLAYDQASTDSNWRARTGLGALVAASFPEGVALRLATPVDCVELGAQGATVRTPTETVDARAVIVTVSTAVLAGDTLELPPQLGPWREAARRLPLGRNEKLFLEILGDAPFEKETQVLGNPRDACTGSYYLRPLDMPVVECFMGGDSARIVEEQGPAAAFAFALDQLSALFGEQIRRHLRPMATSSWGRSIRVGGSYSYALPGQAEARQLLARPFEQRIFFAGEATSRDEFSTVHGAYDSGERAANEVLAALGA